MAVLTLYANQVAAPGADAPRQTPVDDHGKVRIQYFRLEPVAIAGDVLSIIELVDLPPGRVRVLPSRSHIQTTAFGASRTLSFGHRAYQSRPSDNAAVAEDQVALTTSALTGSDVPLDVSAALPSSAISPRLKFDFYSLSGVRLIARVNGGTIPAAATFEGYFTYVYE